MVAIIFMLVRFLLWWARAIFKVAAYAAAIFFVVYTVAYFSVFHGDALGRFISARVNASKRGTFTLGRVDYDYWPGMMSVVFDKPVTAVAHDYTLHDPDGELVLKVPMARTDIHVRELLFALIKYPLSGLRDFSITLHFENTWVPEAMAVIAPLRSTRANPKPEMNIVASMSARKPSKPGNGDFRVIVEDAKLDKIWFGIGQVDADGKPVWSARLDEAHTRASLVYSSRQDLVTADGPYFYFGLQPVEAPRGQLRLGADTLIPLEEVKVREFGVFPHARREMAFRATAKSLGATVEATGALVGAFTDWPGVKMMLDFQEGAGLASLLPKPISEWIGGHPEGQVRFAGPFARVGLHGEVRGVEANLFGVTVKNGESRFQLDRTRLTLDPTTGSAAGGTVKAGIEVQLPTKVVDKRGREKEKPGWWRVKLATRGVDPAQVAILPAAVKAQLKGALDGTARVGGTLVGGGASSSDPIEVSAVDALFVASRPGKLPRRIQITGGLDVAARRVELKQVALAGGGATLGASGTLDPKTGALDSTIALSTLHGARWLEALGVPSALDAGDSRLEGQLRGTVERPAFDGKLVAKDLSLAGRSVDRADARVRLADGTVHVEELKGQGLGADLTGDAELTLFDGVVSRRLPVPRLTARLLGKGVDVKRAAQRDDLEGRADVELLVEGPLSDPKGHLTATLPDLKWGGDPYKNGRLALELGNGGATIQALGLERVRGGALTGHGRFGWDGALDIGLQLDKYPLTAVPSIAHLPIAVGGIVSGNATIGGDTTHPLLGGLLSLLGFRVRDTVFGDGTLKLEPGVDAMHLGGSLFGKVKVDGYLTLFPKFTVSATLDFKDLELERIFPELKKLAEVTGRASGQARLTLDGENGLTYAGVTFDQLTLMLASSEAGGHIRKETVRNDGAIRVSTDGKVIRFDGPARLMSSLGDQLDISGQLSTQTGAEGNDVRLRGRVDLVLLEYFFQRAFDHVHGRGYVDLAIRGSVVVPRIEGLLRIEKAEVVPKGTEQRLALTRGTLRFTPQAIELAELGIDIDGQLLEARGTVKLKDWKPDALAGRVNGSVSPRLVQLVVPNTVSEASGGIKIDASVGGTWARPEFRGDALLGGVSVRLRKLGYELDFADGSVKLEGTSLVIGCPASGAPRDCRRVQGTLDDHPAAVNGRVTFGPNLELKGLEAKLEGSEWEFRAHEWGVTFSPQVTFKGDGEGLRVDGRVDLNDGFYRQNFDVNDALLRVRRTSEHEPPPWQGVALLETMKLVDVKIESSGPLRIENNIAKITGSARLVVGGTLDDPTIDGTVELDPDGTFQPYTTTPFITRRGTVTFDQHKSLKELRTPFLELGGVATVTDAATNRIVKIDLGVTGTLDDLRVAMSSAEVGDTANCLSYLLFGSSTQQIRQNYTQGRDPGQTGYGAGTGSGGNVGDSAAKLGTGIVVGQAIADPFKRFLRMNSLSIQPGTNSFDWYGCWELGRYFRACSLGQVGYSGNTRIEGRFDLRLSDWYQMQLGVQYNTGRNLDTIQDTLTRWRFEPLRLTIPIGY